MKIVVYLFREIDTIDSVLIEVELTDVAELLGYLRKKNERYEEIVRYKRVKFSFLAVKSTLSCLGDRGQSPIRQR